MTTPLSDERIAEIRERCDKATPGPWSVDEESGDVWVPSIWRSVAIIEDLDLPLVNPAADRAFIAAARTDMPDLLAEVERLRRLEEAVTTMPPDTRYTPQVAGRLLWHWEQGFRHDNHTQMVEWLAGIRRALGVSDGDATE